MENVLTSEENLKKQNNIIKVTKKKKALQKIKIKLKQERKK